MHIEIHGYSEGSIMKAEALMVCFIEEHNGIIASRKITLAICREEMPQKYARDVFLRIYLDRITYEVSHVYLVPRLEKLGLEFEFIQL